MGFRIFLFLVSLAIACVGFATLVFSYLNKTERFEGILTFESERLCFLDEGIYLDPRFCSKNADKADQPLQVWGVREPLELCGVGPERSGSCVSVVSSGPPDS